MHAKPGLRVFLKWMIARSGSVITDVITPQENQLVGEPRIRFSIRAALLVIAAICLLIACNRNGTTEVSSGKGDMLTYSQGWPFTHVELTEFVGVGAGADMVSDGWPDHPFASIQLGRFISNCAVWLTIVAGLPMIVEYVILVAKRKTQSPRKNTVSPDATLEKTA